MRQRLSRAGRSILPLSATATAAFLVWLNHHRDVYCFSTSDALQQIVLLRPRLSHQQQRQHHQHQQRKSFGLSLPSSATVKTICEQRREDRIRLKGSNAISTESNIRTGKTPADKFYRKYSQIPEPPVMHAVLATISKTEEDGNSSRSGILVIGDVHGCYDELLLLYEKAVAENHGRPFHYVILVGDLCNKGPQSAAVIRHVRLTDRWLSIRGNHENGLLHAVLGGAVVSDHNMPRPHMKKFEWAADGSLSDEDIMWMAQLPYTIRIPGSVLDEDVDTIVVHAGLVPGVELEQQYIKTMVTIRELRDAENSMGDGPNTTTGSAKVAWASLWKGPEKIIFGHDARRGLQQYECATGLDTGAVYGKQLTGIILPERKLVQVDSLEIHCPIGSD